MEQILKGYSSKHATFTSNAKYLKHYSINKIYIEIYLCLFINFKIYSSVLLFLSSKVINSAVDYN